MIDSEYSTNILKIFESLESLWKLVSEQNSELLKVIPDHPKTKNMCQHAVKKLPFVTEYVLDQYKTQQKSVKAVLENGGALGSVPDLYTI